MSSIKSLVLGTVAMLGLAGTANAAFVPTTWVDNIGGTTYIGSGQTYTYTHSLDNFTALSDVVTDFSLSIDLFDDDKRDSAEIALISLTGIPQGVVSSFQFGDNAFSSGVTLLGFIELNLYGTLTVTVNSLFGDFNLGTSSLVAHGYAQEVPEPGTIALLGLGLLGVGLGRRKKLAR